MTRSAVATAPARPSERRPRAPNDRRPRAPHGRRRRRGALQRLHARPQTGRRERVVTRAANSPQREPLICEEAGEDGILRGARLERVRATPLEAAVGQLGQVGLVVGGELREIGQVGHRTQDVRGAPRIPTFSRSWRRAAQAERRSRSAGRAALSTVASATPHVRAGRPGHR